MVNQFLRTHPPSPLMVTLRPQWIWFVMSTWKIFTAQHLYHV